MEKQLVIKVKRFLELSVKFSKTMEELFPQKGNNNITIGNYTTMLTDLVLSVESRKCYVDKEGFVKAEDNKPLTLAQKILAEAEKQAIVANEFDEYVSLRNELGEYFESYLKVLL